MKNRKCSRFAKVSLLGAVVGILALVLYAVLATDGEKSSPLVYGLLVAGIVVEACPALLAGRWSSELFDTVAGWVGTVLYAVALVVFVSERVQWLYAILSKMEAAPLTALFPTTICAFVVATAVAVIALFFSSWTQE